MRTAELLQTYDFRLPSNSVEFIRIQAEQYPDELAIETDQRTAVSLISETRKLIGSELVHKPNLAIGSLSLSRYENCTDDTAVLMRLAEAVGEETLAVWSGGHASAIMPRDGCHWRLDNSDSASPARYSKTPYPHVNMAKVEKIDEALKGIGSSSGAYIFCDNTDGWKYQVFDGDDIRSASPLTDFASAGLGEKRIFDISVVAAPPLSYRMLSAIDLLGFLKGYRDRPEAEELYRVAREEIGHLVPRTRSA